MVARSTQPSIGSSIKDIETPALVVDLETLERNLHQMARIADRAGVGLRPHAKTHKCSTIAMRQMARGATGVCCQTLREAEAMVRAGVSDVLITNQIVDDGKLNRLCKLAKQATVSVCVDHPVQVEKLSAAADSKDVYIDVLIEVDIGGNRCGVQPGDAVLDLAQSVCASSKTVFKGVHAYQGLAQHIRSYAKRKEVASRSAAKLGQTLELLAANGFTCDIVTGSGTGTFPFDIELGLYNEIQPGSYVFMDVDYGDIQWAPGPVDTEFEQCLFVLTQVISTRADGVAVVDAGLKALAFDSGMPAVHDNKGISYTRPSDEHGILEVSGSAKKLPLGSKLKLVPGHCDPTVNLHRALIGLKHDRVEAVWPIDA